MWFLSNKTEKKSDLIASTNHSVDAARIKFLPVHTGRALPAHDAMYYESRSHIEG